VVIKTLCNEKVQVNIVLVMLKDCNRLPPYMILNGKTVPKEQLLKRNHCQGPIGRLDDQ
jgi:hypothetical protein